MPVIGEDGIPIPSTLSQWLNLIKLEGYQNRFNINGYGNMDRVRVIWELELVTVSSLLMILKPHYYHYSDNEATDNEAFVCKLKIALKYLPVWGSSS